MYSHFFVPRTLPDIDHAANQQHCPLIGNWSMILPVTLIAASCLVAYGFELHFSLTAIAAAHVTTIVMAATLKLGYELRCIALRVFGSEEF